MDMDDDVVSIVVDCDDNRHVCLGTYAIILYQNLWSLSALYRFCRYIAGLLSITQDSTRARHLSLVHVKEAVRCIIHTILFNRALGPRKTDRSSSTLGKSRALLG